LPDSLLAVEDIAARRGTVQVLFDVSLTVGAGEAIALLGRNGAGKTTTLRSIMGLSPPFRGQIRFAGVDITGWPTYKIARVGLALVPEDRGMVTGLTVLENLKLFWRVNGGSGAWDLERVFDLFPALRGLARRHASQLSGGEQQMLAIGRALLANPRLLLLDEPLQGLAPKVVNAIVQSMVRVREAGVGFLLGESSLRALDVVEHAYIIDRGVIRFSGTPEQLRTKPDILEAYLGIGA